MRDLEAGRIPEKEDTDKRKGWMIDGCFLDFPQPVTHATAMQSHRMLKAKIETMMAEIDENK
jgi:hypothetical protein